MSEQRISTGLMTELVSAVAGRPVTVLWRNADQMANSETLGHAGWNHIGLRRALGVMMDSRLPHVFWHEVGHVLLAKRQGDMWKSPAEREAEAETFADQMLARGGAELFWKLGRWLNSSTPLARAVLAEGRAEVVAVLAELRRLTTSVRALPALATNSPGAAQLEAQAAQEMRLADKVADPKVAAMIRRSANGKRQLAAGQFTDPASQRGVHDAGYEKHIFPSHVTVARGG